MAGAAYCADNTSYEAQKLALSEYKEDGSKKWDLNASSAQMNLDDKINLSNPKGVLYEDGRPAIELNSNKGTFNKSKKNIILNDNVVVEHKLQNSVLKTDSLKWESETSLLKTDDPIRITREDTLVTGKEFEFDKDREVGIIKKDVKIRKFDADEKKHPTIITCEGKMEVKYKDNLAEFFDNVVVTDPQATLKADYIRVILNKEKHEVENIYCEGNVYVVQGDKKAVSQQANYDAIEKTIVLTGNPRLMKTENLLGADKITFYMKDERVVCEPQARLIIFPTKEDKEIFEL